MGITDLLSTATVTISQFLDDMGLGPQDVDELQALIAEDPYGLCQGQCHIDLNTPMQHMKIPHLTYVGIVLARRESNPISFASYNGAMLYCLRCLEQYLAGRYGTGAA